MGALSSLSLALAPVPHEWMLARFPCSVLLGDRAKSRGHALLALNSGQMS